MKACKKCGRVDQPCGCVLNEAAELGFANATLRAQALRSVDVLEANRKLADEVQALRNENALLQICLATLEKQAARLSRAPEETSQPPASSPTTPESVTTRSNRVLTQLRDVETAFHNLWLRAYDVIQHGGGVTHELGLAEKLVETSGRVGASKESRIWLNGRVVTLQEQYVQQMKMLAQARQSIRYAGTSYSTSSQSNEPVFTTWLGPKEPDGK